MWKEAYERQGYTVATSDEIYDRVVGLVNRVIGKKTKDSQHTEKQKTSTHKKDKSEENLKRGKKKYLNSSTKNNIYTI
jgi:hypothetical protein